MAKKPERAGWRLAGASCFWPVGKGMALHNGQLRQPSTTGTRVPEPEAICG